MSFPIKNLQFFVFLFLFFPSFSQPVGYYNTASGLTGSNLKTALYNIIKNHTSVSYTPGVWNAFSTTDIKSGSTIWDIYTDIPSGTPVYTFYYSSDQCGSYVIEGDCYNREHSFPQSWFNEVSPMVTDIFHIYPTDGKVNGMRDNYPLGEVGTATYTSSNGSKLGNCNFPGYSGVVFEPIDEYKGDIARSYFYMATRYENVIASWENFNSNGDVVLNGSSYPAYESWFITMLLQWHAADPVSAKEISRNNAIYAIQNNRNPFIDHPEYANQIWSAYAPVKPEPSNHVADFTARKITLQWTDATGAELPDGYLIRMSSVGFSSIADPVDGVEIAESSTSKHIPQGTQTCTFADLQGNTTYYFKIYSYKGSGSTITYKTDGAIPQTSKKTN
jgi:endonuclease I